MREMKNSGVKWIKQIPAQWDLQKLKYLTVKCERGTSPDYTDDIATMVVNQATFSKGFFDISNIRYSRKPALTSRGLLHKGDVLLASTGGGVLGKSNYFDEDGIYVADSHVTVVRTKEELCSKYLYYYFFVNFDTFNSQMAVGSTNQTELQRDLLCAMIVPLPAIIEQRKIADFLDTKCTEIDLLISDIQAQTDALEQYKRSVITEAVTKGLNPDAEMKDSGIPWLSKLPRHWDIIPSKYLFHNSDVRRYPSDVQLTASQNWGIIPQEEYMERTGAKIVFANHGLDSWKHVEPDDFVISLRSFQGGLEMSEVVGCITWHYVVLKAAQPIVPRFYKWLFKSDAYIAALQRTCNFIRDGQDLRYSNFSQVPIYIPPMVEQQQIADYLDKRCSRIDEIIKEKCIQLSVLGEYKKSLIFEYVTGKKEVPDVTSPVTITAIDPHIILAGIAINSLGERQLGKIQLEKALYLLDYYLGLGLNTQYRRYPHGPYDLDLDSYLSALQSRGWFKKISSYPEKYAAGEKYCDFCEERESNPVLLNTKDGIDKILAFIKTMKKTSQVERVATLFAAWNDFLIDGITPSDDQIIQEVMNNWTENKGNTQYLTWKNSLDKLKRNSIIPKGIGLHTLPMMQKGEKSDA